MIKVGDKTIASGAQPFIVAEMSCNHLGDLTIAQKIIRAAHDCGADAVKIQTYTPDTITMQGPQEHFHINHPLWKDMTLHELYGKAQTPFEWVEPLFEYAKEIGIPIFSAPFDLSAVEALEKANNPIYKIASFEIVHIPLIEAVAKTQKPLIISTGMANKEDISRALETARNAGAKDIVLLHCISGYPTPLEEIHLNRIKYLAQEFDVMVGLSDHTKGTLASSLAVGLGAVLIEKHLMLDKDDPSMDKEFSLTPDEFKTLVKDCKNQNPENFERQKNTQDGIKALGDQDPASKNAEKNSYIFRPSILVKEPINPGDVYSEQNLCIRRPSAGLPPFMWSSIIGKKATQSLMPGDGLKLEDIAGN